MATSAMMVLDPKPSLSELPSSLTADRFPSFLTADEDGDLCGRSSRCSASSVHCNPGEVGQERSEESQARAPPRTGRGEAQPVRFLVIGYFMEMIDQNNGIVRSTTRSSYYVRILSILNRDLLKPSAFVALHRLSKALLDVLLPEANLSISLLS